MTAVTGVPEVFAKRQGGLFDVVLHPNFATNNTVFLAYAAGSEDSNQTTVARGVLDGSALTDVTVIFESAQLSAVAVTSEVVWPFWPMAPCCCRSVRATPYVKMRRKQAASSENCYA